MRANFKKLASAVMCSTVTAGGFVAAQIAPALAAPTAGAGQAAQAPQIDLPTYNELGVLEDRFFSRQYANDPLEKRLERLELLVFGGTQGGNNFERMGRLRKALAERAKKGAEAAKKDIGETRGSDAAAGKDAGANGSAASGSAGDKNNSYPVINTLEWKALKKTYQNENIDQRLNRLETKLFGQASPGMTYFDRIDRVKRTLGIGVATTLPQGGFSPMPKARPRSGQDLDFGWGQPMPQMTPDAIGGMPGMGGMPGVGAMPGMDQNMDMASTLSRMMQEMNRQMGVLHGMQGGNQAMPFGFGFGMPGQGQPNMPGQALPNMPGMKGFSKSWSFKLDPNTGQWSEEHSETPIGGPEANPAPGKAGTGGKTGSGVGPKAKPANPPVTNPWAPGSQSSPFFGDYGQQDYGPPPYADPNSI